MSGQPPGLAPIMSLANCRPYDFAQPSDFTSDLLLPYCEEPPSLGVKEGNFSPKYEGTWSESSLFSVPTIQPHIHNRV